MLFKGHAILLHERRGQVISKQYFNNNVTDQGVEAILDTFFNGASGINNWYIGLIAKSVATVTLQDSDVGASHAGWSEFVDYDETERQVWNPEPASNKIVVNTSPAVFTINDNNYDVYGIFITDSPEKGVDGTNDILWATAAFSAVRDVQAGDTLRIIYGVEGGHE